MNKILIEHIFYEVMIYAFVYTSTNFVNSSVRSSRPKVFCKKRVFLEISQNSQKNTCASFFFNKVAGLRSATLLKKILWHRYFPMNFAKFLRKPFPTKHLRWLLLFCAYSHCFSYYLISILLFTLLINLRILSLKENLSIR